MNNYVSEMISTFIDFLNDSTDIYQEALKDLSDSDRETQDLLHFIEFEKVDARTRMQIYKKLKAIRQKRRCAKNTVELLQPIVQWNDKHGDAIDPLNKKILPSVQAIEIMQETRKYTTKSDVLKNFSCKIVLKNDKNR